jgi:hypothetical protein
VSRERVRVQGGVKVAEMSLARSRQQAAVPAAAGSEPNSGDLGFPGSGTSATSRANRPGWRCRLVRSGPFVTDSGGMHRRSQAEAAVSSEGGVEVEQRNARGRASVGVGLALGRTEPEGLTPARRGQLGRPYGLVRPGVLGPMPN